MVPLLLEARLALLKVVERVYKAHLRTVYDLVLSIYAHYSLRSPLLYCLCMLFPHNKPKILKHTSPSRIHKRLYLNSPYPFPLQQGPDKVRLPPGNV